MEPFMTRTTPPPLNVFSPHASLWLRGPCVEAQSRWRARQVGAQPERHTWNPHHGEPSGWRRHGHDPKGPRAKVPRSSTCDVPLTQPF
jgi:hypothetical protein